MIRPSRWFGIVLVLGSLQGRPARAQLTLAAALREADAGAYANRIARANARTQQAQALVPLRSLLPAVRVETGMARTTDPVGVFGMMLRQRAVTAAAFDPARLNAPPATSDYTGALILDAPMLNVDAWAARRGAGAAADASRASAEWTRLTTRADVVRAYYGAILAAEHIATLDAAVRAARAHVAQAEAMQRQGFATKADRLLARVRAGEIEAQRIEAGGAAATAVQQLALMLGRDVGVPIDVPASLPNSARIRAVVADDTASRKPIALPVRADVSAATLGRDAAQADARRARATMLPRVNAIARYDWHDSARLYGGEKSWTVGVVASWSLFTGASELADIRAAGGRADAAQAQLDAADARARVEVEQTRTALLVALARLTLAEDNVTQSIEARRLVERRYVGGLATVSELLDAQASETGSALALSGARYAVLIAGAERRRALGIDPGTLAVLAGPEAARADAAGSSQAVRFPHAGPFVASAGVSQ